MLVLVRPGESSETTHERTVMKVHLLAGALIVAAACSSASDLSSPNNDVAIDGPLRFTLTDAPTSPGVLFISANATGGTGALTITSTRYGSLCATAVSAHADLASGAVLLKVKYSERTAMCTADIRAITYKADISGLAAGVHSVRVVHATAPDTTGNVVYTSSVTVK